MQSKCPQVDWPISLADVARREKNAFKVLLLINKFIGRFHCYSPFGHQYKTNNNLNVQITYGFDLQSPLNLLSGIRSLPTDAPNGRRFPRRNSPPIALVFGADQCSPSVFAPSVYSNQPKVSVATTAPISCARINADTCAGAIPAKVSENPRAIVTAGFAKLVEAVNQ